MSRRCIDCQPATKRPAPHPGPRCFSHHKAVVRARRDRAHELRVQKTYGLSAGAYRVLYALQGERCAICQRATGKTKRLAVDHRHSDNVVRGLLCGPCNQMLGYAHDDPAVFERAAEYLRNPPAQALTPRL